MYYLVALLFILAIILLSRASHQRRAAGLPGGRIISADTSTWLPQEKPLYDSRLDLAGKPDYLVQEGDAFIPVEVKSSRVGEAPYDAHIYQLAAYCRLVEAKFLKRPPYGILHYPNHTFRIDYTPELENELFDILVQMRSKRNKRQVPRSHASQRRCQKCGYSSLCDQRLH